MTTLEDLYYGNISPHERCIKRGTRVDKLVKLICKNEEELNAGLTEKQKETFEKFKDCTSELSCITEREAFSSGFILATRIMTEVMQGLEEVEDVALNSLIDIGLIRKITRTRFDGSKTSNLYHVVDLTKINSE